MTQFMSNSLFFGAAISLIAYEAGLLLKRKFKMAIFNPLLIAIIAVIAVLCLLHIDYDTYNQSGQYISYLLTPATVCLAVPLYQQMELLKKNLKAVIIGIVSGVLASLVSVLILAKLFSLSHEQYVTLLPKSITTAIGMGVSEELGGIVTITVAVIIITGVLGNMIAETVIKLARIEEPIAKGLALGTSAHAIGTAKAMELGEIEGAMSSLAIAVAGLLTVILAGPDIVSRGFVYVRESEDLMDGAREVVENALDSCLERNITDWGKIKTVVKDALSEFLWKRTKRSPMILPIIMEA